MLDYDEKLVCDNLGLVYTVVFNMKISSNDPEFEDIISEGKIGLIKAAKHYDSSKGIKFGTYAYICIHNEIIKYFKNKNKKDSSRVLYFSDLIVNDIDNTITIEDSIEDSNSQFLDEVVINSEFEKLINIILNYFNNKNRAILLFWLSGLSQTDISHIYNMTRSNVNRIIKRSIIKIRDIANKNVKFNNNIIFKVGYNYYKFIFVSKEAKAFFVNSHIDSHFKTDTTKENEGISLIMPRNYALFSLVAELLNQFDDYVSNISNN